jgi:hypothetical protein
MNLTNQQLEEIKELASLLLEPEEIAVLMDIDTSSFLDEIESRRGDVY